MNSSQSFSPDSTQLQAVIALCPTLLILNTFHFIRWVTLSLFPFSSVILHEVQSSCLFFCGRKESTAVPQTHLLMAFFLAVCRGVGRSCSFPLHHPLSAGGRVTQALDQAPQYVLQISFWYCVCCWQETSQFSGVR